MPGIKGAQRRRTGHIIAAYLWTGFINIAEKNLPVPVEECAALHMYTGIVDDDISEPAYLISPHMGYDVCSALLFPTLHIFLCDVGDHVYMAAGTALQALYGRVIVQNTSH